METISIRHSNRYWAIIEHAKSLLRKRGEAYYERHHIVPRALGGGNDPANLVLLTAREHFICHYLLWKMTGDYGMLCAVMRMRRQNQITTSRLYEAARVALAAARRGVQFTGEHKAKLAAAKKGATGNNRHLWDVTTPDGEVRVIQDRRAFCSDHGLNFESVKVYFRLGRPYKGYIFTKHEA